MKIPRRYWIEILIVLAVLALLLIVMIPRFQQAQILQKVTQARDDLHEIAKAMAAYNVSESGYGVQEVNFLFDNAASEEPLMINVNSLTDTASIVLIPEYHFLPYLVRYPSHEFPLRYVGMDGVNRSITTAIVQKKEMREMNVEQFPSEPFYSADWYRLNLNREYLGSTAGPCITVSKSNNLTEYYRLYDPSNGVMSHGLILYLSPQ